MSDFSYAVQLSCRNSRENSKKWCQNPANAAIVDPFQGLWLGFYEVGKFVVEPTSKQAVSAAWSKRPKLPYQKEAVYAFYVKPEPLSGKHSCIMFMEEMKRCLDCHRCVGQFVYEKNQNSMEPVLSETGFPGQEIHGRVRAHRGQPEHGLPVVQGPVTGTYKARRNHRMSL